MSDVKLTEDQEIAVEAMKQFLDDPNEDIFTLSGVGGAGKTFCVKEVLHGRTNVIGATVSHSAKVVLAQSLAGVAECVTVAQLLGLGMQIGEDGEIRFLPKRRGAYAPPLPIETGSIFVIDECSMIDDFTFEMIMELKGDGTKVLFLGDHHQLPPIEDDKDSVTFNYIGARLPNPVRYKGPIIDLGNRIRDEIDKVNNEEIASKFVINEWMNELGHEERTSRVDEDGHGFIFLNDIDTVVNLSNERFRNSTNPENLRLIAFRNKTISTINDVIRAQVYGEDPELWSEGVVGEGELNLPQFMPGELVICDGGYNVTYMDMNEDVRTQNVIYNNQTFVVRGSVPITGPYNIPCLAMSLDPDLDLPKGTEICVMEYENGRHAYWERLNYLKNKAKADSRQWVNYYNFRDKFCRFDYNYGQNSHRAQGRTYDEVIIFENDILTVSRGSLKSKLQALYVACTRAKHRVYIYNKKFRVNQELLPDSIKEELGI